MTISPLFCGDEIPRFHLERAKILAADCSSAYRGVTLQSDKTDAGVLITETANCIVITFRGTRNVRDWLMDARFMKRVLKGKIRVHSGFYDDADSLLGKIIALIGGTTKPIIVTGHSLGGALATLIAYILARSSNLKIALVYTFASPRVGNGYWRAAYESLQVGEWTLGERTFRIDAEGDCVPLVPGIFCTPLDGYRHVGNEVFLAPCDCGCDSVEYRINPSHWAEFFQDQWRCAAALRRRDFGFLTQFHSIDQDYISLLAKCKN